jgi:hypothetical protein
MYRRRLFDRLTYRPTTALLVVLKAPLLNLALALISELFPRLCHLFELLPVLRLRRARHLATFGSVLEILFDLFHRDQGETASNAKISRNKAPIKAASVRVTRRVSRLGLSLFAGEQPYQSLRSAR